VSYSFSRTCLFDFSRVCSQTPWNLQSDFVDRPKGSTQAAGKPHEPKSDFSTGNLNVTVFPLQSTNNSDSPSFPSVVFEGACQQVAIGTKKLLRDFTSLEMLAEEESGLHGRELIPPTAIVLQFQAYFSKGQEIYSLNLRRDVGGQGVFSHLYLQGPGVLDLASQSSPTGGFDFEVDGVRLKRVAGEESESQNPVGLEWAKKQLRNSELIAPRVLHLEKKISANQSVINIEAQFWGARVTRYNRPGLSCALSGDTDTKELLEKSVVCLCP
jgi:hypothetical protein